MPHGRTSNGCTMTSGERKYKLVCKRFVALLVQRIVSVLTGNNYVLALLAMKTATWAT